MKTKQKHISAVKAATLVMKKMKAFDQKKSCSTPVRRQLNFYAWIFTLHLFLGESGESVVILDKTFDKNSLN